MGIKSEQLATPSVDHGMNDEEREKMRTETNKPISPLKSAGTTKWQKSLQPQSTISMKLES